MTQAFILNSRSKQLPIDYGVLSPFVVSSFSGRLLPPSGYTGMWSSYSKSRFYDWSAELQDGKIIRLTNGFHKCEFDAGLPHDGQIEGIFKTDKHLYKKIVINCEGGKIVSVGEWDMAGVGSEMPISGTHLSFDERMKLVLKYGQIKYVGPADSDGGNP